MTVSTVYGRFNVRALRTNWETATCLGHLRGVESSLLQHIFIHYLRNTWLGTAADLLGWLKSSWSKSISPIGIPSEWIPILGLGFCDHSYCGQSSSRHDSSSSSSSSTQGILEHSFCGWQWSENNNFLGTCYQQLGIASCCCSKSSSLNFEMLIFQFLQGRQSSGRAGIWNWLQAQVQWSEHG